MQRESLLLAVLSLAFFGSSNLSYLPTIRARWNASDLVCTGEASAPEPTGATQVIDGAKRDQLSANVELERCFKGEMPRSSEIRVHGDYFVALEDIRGGYGYSGPPLGFVHEGRNLLFLRRSSVPDLFLVTVPIYQTAIPLADAAPTYPPATSPEFLKTVLTRELESAMVQTTGDNQGVNSSQPFGEGLLSDIEYIDLLADYLGKSDGAAELSRFSETAPASVRQDIVVTLLGWGLREYEPAVISVLLDVSVPAWKRENAAFALGRYGSQAALAPLRSVASEAAGTEDQKQLKKCAESSLQSLEQRLRLDGESP